MRPVRLRDRKTLAASCPKRNMSIDNFLLNNDFIQRPERPQSQAEAASA